MPSAAINRLLSRISGSKGVVGSHQIAVDVLKHGLEYTLERGIGIKAGRVAGRQVLQLLPPDARTGQDLTRLGAIYEKGLRPIYYLGTDRGGLTEAGGDALKRILEQYPVSKTEGDDAGGNLGPGAANVEERPQRPLMAGLTDSIRNQRKLESKSTSLRMKDAAVAAKASVEDKLSQSWQSLKGAAAELWDSYRQGGVRYSDFDQANRDRIGSKQEAAIYANAFSRELKARTTLAQREAMVNYLEAGEDADPQKVLEERAEQSRPQFRRGYEDAADLPDDLRVLVNNIRAEMDAQLEEAQKRSAGTNNCSCEERSM